MFKSVLIILVVIVLLLLIRSIMQRFKQPATKNQPLNDGRDTAQCLHCKIYVPREDAIINNNQTFCSTQHLQKWNRVS